ncbi:MULTISPECIES: collagen-binding domain-containing protein [unclassified Duganella]|uniref:collagen-binding domain-containing protein n=1 Tax=unclassified Duganella TaxID=2636909 RepID=UPI001E64B21C|nr:MULTISPECIES: collagen-binding domain-containing protein [unclassified Duganella]
MTALAAAALFVANAQAATTPLTATQMLQQFNLVVSKDLHSTSHVQGRTFVGGDAVAQDFVQKPEKILASDYAGVTVLGNMSSSSNQAHVDALGLYVGGSTTNVIVNKGDATVGGSATGGSFQGNTWINGSATNVNLNGATHAASSNGNPYKPLAEKTSTMLKAEAAATSTDFGSVMTTLSKQLSTLKGTDKASVTIDTQTNSKVTFSGKADSSGLLVFDLTGIDDTIFSPKITDFYFNLTGATTVIFNTDETTLSLNANFQDAEANGSKFIWNFAGASNVTVEKTFGGQVLVAGGTFTNAGGGANVEGGVYAQSVNEYGQMHIQTFTGTIPAIAAVPEPETYAMLLAGLGIVGFMGRRRQKAAAAR